MSGNGAIVLKTEKTTIRFGGLCAVNELDMSDDDPTKVFDSASSQEFSANEAITGPGMVVPESGIPISTGDGDLTERRAVDPASGDVSDAQMDTTAEFGQKVDGKGKHRKA